MAEKFWMPPSREELEFQNILLDENLRPLAWATKLYTPKKAFDRPSNYSNPLTFRYKVLIDPHINALMKKEFPDESAYQRLNSILNEIGFSKNIAYIRILGFVLMKIMLKTISAGYMNEVRFLQLRANMGRNPVIFVPSHRSYADFILLSAACFQCNVEVPVIITGIDFYGLSIVIRETGAMFMRRSFKDDKVYGAVFKKYLETVITKCSSPIEFFIEGMRSRSNKSVAPKLGILKTIVGVYKSNLVDDITFVPITFNYDRLLEDSLFAREVMGVPKPKESATTLLKSMTFLEQFYGSVYMNVGNTISLKDFVQQRNTADDYLLDLAHTIVKSQQENVIITISSLLCSAILCGLLSSSENSINVTFLHDTIPRLRKALTLFGAISTSSGSIDADIKRTVKLHKFLKMNEEEKSSVFVFPYARRGVPNRNIEENATTIITIQHYVNPCYHFLVSPAIIISILCSEKSVNEYDLLERYRLCRKLFKYEFLFFQQYESEDYGKAIAVLIELKLIQCVNGEFSACITELDTFWLSLLLPFLRGYLFIYRCLLQISGDQFIEAARLKSRIKKSLELELDIIDDISLYYTFSFNLLSCALQSLNDMDVIKFKSLSDRIQILDISQLKILVHFLSKLELRPPYDQMMNPSLCATSCKL